MRTKSVVEKNSSSRIDYIAPWRLNKVQPLNNYTLEVEFVDGTSGFVELANLIVSDKAGVFAALKNLDLFNQVFVQYGVITWPGEIDLAPEVMYEAIQHGGKCIFN